MKIFSLFTSKKRFADGSVIWPSGRERFSYKNRIGQRVDFEVLYSKIGRDAENIIVTSSIDSFADGQPISAELKAKIIAKCKNYFTEKGQITTII